MKPRVYIETTIASFYHETRLDSQIVARKEWTRQWWDEHRQEYELFTSAAVIDELETGEYPHQEEALNFVRDIPLLPITDEVIAIGNTYIRHHVMPNDPTGDALHLAVASFYQCDFLVTWNCQHLANGNKSLHIQKINRTLRLGVPLLVTPLELLPEENP